MPDVLKIGAPCFILTDPTDVTVEPAVVTNYGPGGEGAEVRLPERPGVVFEAFPTRVAALLCLKNRREDEVETAKQALARVTAFLNHARDVPTYLVVGENCWGRGSEEAFALVEARTSGGASGVRAYLVYRVYDPTAYVSGAGQICHHAPVPALLVKKVRGRKVEYLDADGKVIAPPAVAAARAKAAGQFA